MRPFLLVASAVALGSAAQSCGGSSGKKPKIDSFTASPANMPSLGGDVQLVWQVRDAETVEIEPGIGVVTGTAATVHVTETTTFTLAAKRNGQTARERTTVTVAGPGSVVGRVRLLLSRAPAPNLVVWIKGHGATVSAPDGTFSFEGVEQPYDIAVIDPFDPTAIAYLGVTRLDPVLEVNENFATFQSAPVQGVIAPTPEPASSETYVYFDTDGQLPQTMIVDTSFNSTANWFNTETTGLAVHALRFAVDTTGNLASYIGYGRAETELSANELSTVDVSLAPADTLETTGTITAGGPTTVVDYVTGFVLFGTPTGSFEDEGFFLPDVATYHPDPADRGEFRLRFPDLQGASFNAKVALFDDELNSAYAYLPIEAGSSDVSITLPRPPKLLFPLAESLVGPDTVFLTETREDSVKVHMFQNQEFFGAATLVVLTTEDHLVLPDLSETGFDIFSYGSFDWEVVAEIAPRTSVDEAAGPDGMAGIRPDWYGSSQDRCFVTEPGGGC